MHSQETSLKARKADLERLNSELDQLSSRLSWLIHQIEGACEWVLSSGTEETEASADTEQGTGPEEQVMWAQLIMGQEAERARLAREIHDGPAQALANMVMRLQFVEQIMAQRPQEARGELARLRGAVQDSLKDVRRFVFNLRPASLSDAGLLPTLRYYTRDYSEQYNLPVQLNLPENLVLSANQELVVFRVIQEALQNIQKHAAATRVEVDIQRPRNGPLVVSISDDGKGFNPKAVRQSRTTSAGLVSMMERAATVGGTLKIDSSPGVGTTVTLVLPMPKEN
jgi:two-component system sensor histidine kinase DegS